MELHCWLSFKKIVYIVLCTRCYNIYFELCFENCSKTCTKQVSDWHTISIKRYIRLYKVDIAGICWFFWYQDLLLPLQLIPILLIKFGLLKLLKVVVLEIETSDLCADYNCKIAAGGNFLNGHFSLKKKKKNFKQFLNLVQRPHSFTLKVFFILMSTSWKAWRVLF